jgi:fatty-acyl-CoA synthase
MMDAWRGVHSGVLTPLMFLERSARVHPGKLAVVYGETRRSYRELAERVNRLASALLRRGLRKGDRVAFVCPNTPPMLEAHFGVLLAGGILVSINTRLSAEEIHYILDHSGARFVVVDTEFGAVVGEALQGCDAIDLVVHVADDPAYPALEGPEYEAFLGEGCADPLPWRVDDEFEPIAINYTSGTTGRPKGVTYCHRGAYLNALGGVFETRFTIDSVFMWVVPMFHCNGWCFTWGVTAAAGTHVCSRRWEPAHAWQLIEREGVTHFNGAPVVLISLVNEPAALERFPRPLTICTGGAPPSPTIIERITGLGGHLIHIYGLTEVYGPFTLCAWQPGWKELTPHEHAALLARQGVGYTTGAEVRVVDEHMNDIPCDGVAMGEVVMRGNMVMLGYWNDPEATAAAFRGGWFHSGDVAVWHPDGYIELRDRSKDVIISGGENISSIEVEQCIYRHPAVLECAVIGVPHDKWGEAPKAFVTLKTGANATEAEIIAHCREHIAHFKAPCAVTFGPLPKTSTGKIQKFLLREQEWSGQEKRIKG